MTVDGWLFSWDLWWFKRAVLDLGTTPFFSGEVHYPYGASLLFHSLAPALCLIALPFTTAFGVAVAYNVLAFAGFWLSGYGAYRLSAYVLRDLEPAGETTATRLAAFLGGAAWAFGAYHFAHLLGHLEIASPQWLPFFVLFLVKSWREPGWASPLAAGFFLVMTGLTAWYYWLHLLCFAGLFIVYHLIVDRPPRVYAALVRTSAALGIGNLVLSPWLAPMVLHGSSAALPDHRGQILALSADLVSPFVPSFQHPLWGKWLTPLQLRLMPDGNLSESTLFVGYTSLALAAIASIGRRDRSRFWLVAFLFFWVMSLGPLLHAGGRLVTLFDQPIPMPFLVLSALPSMATFRGTSRFFALGALALGVLTALGSRRLLGRARTTVGRAVRGTPHGRAVRERGDSLSDDRDRRSVGV